MSTKTKSASKPKGSQKRAFPGAAPPFSKGSQKPSPKPASKPRPSSRGK